MDILLFFALPVSTIILSIVLQKILKCPTLVAATFFAIYLIVAFTAFDSSFLIYVIIYTILAYVTAVLTRLICNIIERFNLNRNNCDCENNNENNLITAINKLNNSNDNLANVISSSSSNCNSSMNNNQTRLSLTTNQANPVVYLSNTARRSGCCCRRQ